MSSAITFTVTDLGDKSAQFTIDASETVENLKALIEAQLGFPLLRTALTHNNRPMDNAKKLGDYGIANHDMIVIQTSAQAPQNQRYQQQQQPQRQQGGQLSPAIMSDPAQFIAHVRNDSALLNQLLTQNPQLAEAILDNNTQAVGAFLQQIQRQNQAKLEAQRKQIELSRRLAENPFDVEAQKQMEEAIRAKNVEENWSNAMEHMPESFARVTMLYVPAVVNGHSLPCFVDSGAQSTIMSEACAKRCGIMRLVDRRYSGIAKGVGTSKILGRVHMHSIKVGDTFLPCSFTILENQDMDMLFGLDMLKRHHCCIDLQKSVLRLGASGAEVPFMAEKDLPHLRAEREEEELLRKQREASRAAQQPQSQSSSSNPPNTASSSSSSSSGPAASSFPDASIATLVGLGFARNRAIQALQSTNGNVDLAASLLFQG